MLFGNRLTCSPVMLLQGYFSINFSYSWKHPYILWLCWVNTDWTWIPPSKKKESQLLELQLDVMTMQGDLTNPTITWSPLNLLLRTVPLTSCHIFLYSFTFCPIITPQFHFALRRYYSELAELHSHLWHQFCFSSMKCQKVKRSNTQLLHPFCNIYSFI